MPKNDWYQFTTKKRTGWVDRAGFNSREEMRKWSESELRTAYTLLRPDDWKGSEEDYQKWRADLFGPAIILGDNI